MKALVTGGGGFLGGAVVRMLKARGDEVRSFSRSPYPDLEKLGVEHRQGDLADAEAVARAVEGCDTVFHVAARPGVSCRYDDYYRPNVLGTENVLSGCRGHGVPRLVYTSTPSVVFEPAGGQGIDESAPYGHDFLGAHYAATKAQAERMVLAANDGKLATVALRPHLIWGPGDNHLVPRILARAKAGRLRRIGDGKNLVDSTYIDNAAEAHLLAADALVSGSAVGGRAYFIAQDEPIGCFELINRILAAGGLPPVTRSISPRLAYGLGWCLEKAYGLFGARSEPPMTRFVALQLSTPHWFDLSAAKRDLGYKPRVSLDEGLARLAEWLGKRKG